MQFLATFLTIMIILTASPLSAETTITYQGQLQDAGGPYTGTPDMVFRLYDSLTGTNQIGTDIELQNVPVTDGLFQAELDFGDAYDGARWLEVVVDGNVLEPRQRIAPAPVAVQALNVPDGEDTLAELDCATGHIAKWDGSAWACAEDEDTTYLPGEGLQLSGTIFDLRTEFTDELYWRQGGNAGTDPASDFLGTSDDTPFEIHAGNQRAMRIEPVDDADEGPNVIAGHDRNEATDGVVGATISGGGSGLSGLVDEKNTVGGDHATVGGGRVNTANGSGATIGGGVNNTTGGSNATVSGGINNEASGLASSVPGGDRNTATGDYSLAAGQQAKAEHDGAFVWADSIGADFVSSGSNQFLVRATGGAVISGGSSAVTDPGDARLYVDGTTRVRDLEFDSMAVSSGDALCITSSARVVVCGSTGRLKDDIEPLQNAAELVEQLRPVRYRWKSDGQYDVGLIAEEVAQVLPEIVRYGKSGEVETLQYSRVAAVLVGAFQELELAHGERLESLEVKSARLHEQVAELTKENRRLQQLTERNAKLEDRLATLEALLLEDRQVAGGQQ